MTKIQIKFYNLISNQIIDFDPIFHKDFVIQRIVQIGENQLKYLLENINTDKDNITKNKTYTTYAKFAYYADKMINQDINTKLLPDKSIVDNLLVKRDKLIMSIDKQNLNITQRKEMINDIESKKLMFKGDDGKNMLDIKEYEIIKQFGFYDFFNENKNYKIKEQLDSILKEQVKSKMVVVC